MTVAAAAAAATAAGTAAAAAAAAVPAFDDHGNYLNLQGYPPAPVTWLTATVDTICRFARCRRWRDYAGITAETHPWLAQEVPPLSSSFPPFLRYTDYVVRRQQQQQQRQQQDDDEHCYSSSTITNNYLSLKHMYSYAFETPSTNLGLLTSAESCVTLFALVWILRGLKRLLLPVFCEWGRIAARSSYSRAWAERNQARIDKFGEYVFRLMYHGAITAYGVACFYREPFWHGNTVILFEGFPRHDVPPKLAWYYLLQAAYNVDALVSLLELSFAIQWRTKREEETTTTRTTTRTTTTTTRSWWSNGSTCQRQKRQQQEENHEDATTTAVLAPRGGCRLRGGAAAAAMTSMTTMIRGSCDSLLSLFSSCLPVPVRLPRVVWSDAVRGDFREMFVHHLVTNMLIVGSSYCRLTRSGSMVFFVHDVSDVPVDLSKLANFLKWKKTTIACFCCMVIAWTVFRLYVLPVTIFGSILTQSHRILLPDPDTGERLPVLLYVCYRHLFYSLMVFLMLLHVAWFFMFLKMAYTIAVKYECHDYSEFKRGESSSSSSSVSSSSSSKSVLSSSKLKKHTTTKVCASASAAIASSTTTNGYHHCNGSSSKATAAVAATTAAADHSTTAMTMSNGKQHHYVTKKDE